MAGIAHNLETIRHRIAASARAAGRDPASVRLVAVSKTHPAEAVEAAIAAGQRVFGENRVQEAKAKFEGLRARHADLELHLIGALQTNKAAEAVRIFDVIETLDRPKLAVAFAGEIRKRAGDKDFRAPVFYIEVNVGNEPQKAGVAPGELGAFLKLCREECGLNVEGLMCIPPQGAEPAPFFTQLAVLAKQHGLARLSMGMSADFEAAIACGATELRLGTAIFGERR